MSHRLWEALLQNDAERFRLYLAEATYNASSRQATAPSGSLLKIGSPGSLGTSPHTPLKSRKTLGHAQANARGGRAGNTALTRLDINSKDSFGRTLLHHAATQKDEDAQEFIAALIEAPFVDLYAQDIESGWTPLHRALYFGNITTALALMRRDLQDATDYTTTAAHAQAGGLVKIKDNEGNSPFEVFQLTIAPRILQNPGHNLGDGDDDDNRSVDLNEDPDQSLELTKQVEKHAVSLGGHEVFVFGSNKNLSLGVGDENDRHFPERVNLTRPDTLLLRLYQDHLAERTFKALPDEVTQSQVWPSSVAEIPTLIANKPMKIQNVLMSKLHTAILTDDPICNLHICGFGPGGRLGTGDERTSFKYRCIEGGGLAKKRVSTIALGQDHTIAICSQGEVFTWGSNKYGQLGYTLPEVPSSETPMQLLPRQLYGYVKKELVIGAAASSVHSAIYTAAGLYTFGKNEGQLGLMDADARSSETVHVPRRVAPSVLTTPIASVSAIDRATAVLLTSHEVIVFTHFGYTRVSFGLEGYLHVFDPGAPGFQHNHICKITAGSNSIAALSVFGEVFTVDVPKVAETVSATVSTTNPAKARNALPPSARIWSIRKSHMSATDVAVGQDGSVILCTTSGSVWRKEKRANIKSVKYKGIAEARPKDYKFVRVPNLTRAVAVRSNAFGAYTAIRKDCDVTETQVTVESPTLWSNLFPLLSFHRLGEGKDDETSDNPRLRFWVPNTKGPDPAHLKAAIITQNQAELEVKRICELGQPLAASQYDIWVASTVTDVRIPIHSFVLKGRSKLMRTALTEFLQSYYFTIPDVLSIEYGKDGQIQLVFQGADFLTLANFVIYLYTDQVVDVWHHTSKALHMAPRYRAVRLEVMKIAASLELRQLERAARLMIDPVRSLAQDFEQAVIDADFFSDADVVIDLADGAEVPAHSVLLTARCPFFEGLFQGRTGGLWMASRRDQAEHKAELMRVDLKHVNIKVFNLVLRHVYADTGTELFDDVITTDFDEFAELLLEVLSVANELMIDRLSEICQSILGRYVNIRNVCYLLNTVAECHVTEFKNAALEYICLNLETMLEQRLLEELDLDLLAELDEVVQQNQLAYLPFARSDRAQNELIDQYPDLIERIEEGKQRRIDSMRLRSRLADAEQKEDASYRFRVGSVERYGSSPSLIRRSSVPGSNQTTPEASPAIPAREDREDLPFEMDEEGGLGSPSLRLDATIECSEQQIASSVVRTPPLTPGNSLLLHARQDRPTQEARSEQGSASASRGFGSTTLPWQTPSPTAQRIDLRDIMSQASTSRVSNLSQSLAQAGKQAKSHQKVSQKDRKKQHQQAKQQPEAAPVPPTPATAPSTKPQSPWQAVRKPSVGIVTAKSQEGSSAPSRAAMTMRQTVARSTPTPSPSIEPATSVTAGTSSATKPTQHVIQSIRHTPSRASTLAALDTRASLADILSQQQTEKIAIKEVAAKRSLQEIQQEQEFQAWWDSESRRVKEEEAAAISSAAKTSARPKSGRGRGQSHRRGSGRRGGDTKSGEGANIPGPTRQTSLEEDARPQDVDHGPPLRHDARQHQQQRPRPRGGGSNRSRGGGTRGAH